MADKLMIVMASNAGDPAALATPLAQATVAAAMEYEVEIILTGGCCELARPGVAQGLMPSASAGRNLYDLIREAHRAGVSFKLCTTARDNGGDELIAEIGESVGDAYLISEAMDDATVTFTY